MRVNRKQLAEILGVSVETVRTWDRKGIIPRLKIGHVIRYNPEKVEKALEAIEGKVEVTKQTTGRRPPAEGVAP